MPGVIPLPSMESEQSVPKTGVVDDLKSYAKHFAEPEEGVLEQFSAEPFAELEQAVLVQSSAEPFAESERAVPEHSSAKPFADPGTGVLEVNGDNPQTSATPGSWKLERSDALSLLRSLYEAHSEDEIHRRYLLRRWPELPSLESSKTSLDRERFIPELYIRSDEHDSLQFVKNLVQEGFTRLQEVGDEGGQLDIKEGISRLSDQGVVEAAPLLLPKLQTKALRSILSTLSGRKQEARNRLWLLEKISKELKTFTLQSEDEVSESLVQIFRDPSSFQNDVPRGQLLLNTSSPSSTAESAFDQLDQIPWQCLQVMLEVILDRPPGPMLGNLPGRNKNDIITALTKRQRYLLSDHKEGQALPELLRKSLVVMSLSARYAFGDDGKLIDFLGPLPRETNDLQSNLLSALSDLRKLNYESAQSVFSMLIGAPKQHKKTNPVNFREPIRKVLLDCLLWSEVRVVPEKVKEALVTIRHLAKKSRSNKTKLDAKLKVRLDDAAHIELEVEAILRISSHLQQIMHNRNECISDRISAEGEEEEISLLGVSPVDGQNVGVIPVKPERCSGSQDINVGTLQVEEESTIIRLVDENGELEKKCQSDQFDEFTQRVADMPLDSIDLGVAAVEKPKRKHQEIEYHGLPLAEELENQQLVRIADEVAAVGYALVGCAMERTSRLSGISLKRPVRKYLRNGLKRNTHVESGNTNEEHHQVTMILCMAKNIPVISDRALNNVKKRLGMG